MSAALALESCGFMRVPGSCGRCRPRCPRDRCRRACCRRGCLVPPPPAPVEALGLIRQIC
eukprot:896218-Heterocapsa_arctica.AAC.1